MVAECWPDMTDEMRSQAPPRISEALFPIVMKKHCPEAGIWLCAWMRYRAGHPNGRNLKVEKRWEKSQETPSAFPEIEVEEGCLAGAFVEGVPIPSGYSWGCTPTAAVIGSAAETSAWHGQENRKAVLRGRAANVIVAQSWAWKTPTHVGRLRLRRSQGKPCDEGWWGKRRMSLRPST